jgi:magnesium transporter
MIKICKKTINDKTLKSLRSFNVGAWVYVEDPNEKEIKYLVKNLNLEADLLQDALDPHEVPRLEVEEQITYIFTRVPYREEEKVITIPLLIAISNNFLTTICSKKLPFLEDFTHGKEIYTTQKTRLFLQIFSRINQVYNKFLTDISKNVRSVSVKLEKIENKDVIRFVNFEIILNDFLTALNPINNLLQDLLSGKFLKLYEKDKDLIEDLSLGTGQLIERCRADLKTIVNIRESYSTIITNNLNRVIKLLTALTIILTIPTIIASIYGMNVRLPLADNPLAFNWIIGITFLFSLAALLVLLKKRWF